MLTEIVVKKAAQHNLKRIDVRLPRQKLIVVTGPSGSGKSSLAFDTLFAEGQRRYVESLSSYARQFLGRLDKPDVDHIEGLSPGIYRYLPLEHRLLFEFTEENLRKRIVHSALGQPYTGEAAVTFIWTSIPYRMEWRYGIAAHKVIAIDAGHVCQNLYLACEAIGSGACAIAAYDQEAMDDLLRIDGENEMTIYLASVGKWR